MRKDSGEIGKRGQLYEAANKSVEGGRRADVDTGEDGDNGTADEGRVEGVVHPGVDMPDPVRERGSSVTSQGPEGTAGSDIATSAVDDSRQEGHNQKTEATTP